MLLPNANQCATDIICGYSIARHLPAIYLLMPDSSACTTTSNRNGIGARIPAAVSTSRFWNYAFTRLDLLRHLQPYLLRRQTLHQHLVPLHLFVQTASSSILPTASAKQVQNLRDIPWAK
jgi:hypothetical protein